MNIDEPNSVQDISSDTTSSADLNFVNDANTSDLQSVVARSISPSKDYD